MVGAFAGAGPVPAAALLPWARRDRLDSTARAPRGTALHDHGDVGGALADPVGAALCTRPDALGGRPLVGVDGCDYQSARGSRPALFWALAAALAITLATGSLAACGAQRRMSRASSTDLPRTRLITRRALLAEKGKKRALAVAEEIQS